MLQSKGIVLHGNKRAEIVVEEAAMPTGRQVLIKTHAVGLCGSDIALYNGTSEGPKNYPIYFGHEWSGVVEAVGPEVVKVRPGDKVTGDCSLFCGACEFCALDKNLCKFIEKQGITQDGASRQYVLQDEKYVYRADPAADLNLVALSEPLAVGAHAVQRVSAVRSDLKQAKVLVLGGGTIGFSCFFALKYIYGCQRVELYDLVESRVDKAIRLGAAEPTDVLTSAGDANSYGGMYSGRGYDIIFESTGSPAAFRQAVDLLRPLGIVVALGFIHSVEFSLKTITLKAAQVMGSIGGTGEFETVLDFIVRHPGVASQIISHRIPFEDYDRAFAAASDRQNAMKVLIEF